MHCSSCGFDNPEGMKFCGECAAPLQNRCPQCGFENPPRFKFCGDCATPLVRQSKVQGLKSEDQPPTPTPQPPISYTPPHLMVRILATQAAMEARGAMDG